MPATSTPPDEPEKALEPTALMAAKLKVYTSPSVSPVTVHIVDVLVCDPGHTLLPGVEVVMLASSTVKPVIGRPPVDDGAFQLTVADSKPLASLRAEGTPGAVTSVTLAEEPENAPVPAALMAATLKVYASPRVSPDAAHVVDVLVVDEGHTSGAAVDVVTFSSLTV